MELVLAQLQIVNEIEARLANIKKANGYSIDIKKIDRSTLQVFGGRDLPAVNFYLDEDIAIDSTDGSFERQATFIFELYDRERDTSLLDRTILLSNDIFQALSRSTELPAISDRPSLNLGGMVNECVVTRIQPAMTSGQKPYVGCHVTVVVEYEVRKDDPYHLI